MRLQHGWELNLALLNPTFPDLAELKITMSWAGLILHLGFDLLICMRDLSPGSLCRQDSKAIAVVGFLNAAPESLAVSELQGPVWGNAPHGFSPQPSPSLPHLGLGVANVGRNNVVSVLKHL